MLSVLTVDFFYNDIYHIFLTNLKKILSYTDKVYPIFIK